jgi:tRNA dimethylallyltransferase
LALLGPTASGKTRLAIELALALNGEIISVDSGMVYRGMDIGTAKPSLVERRGVPHHLVDILDPSEIFSTGEFRTRALASLAEITARGRLPILVGGTMLYFHALFHGLAELPPRDPALRRQIEAEARARGWAALHAELKRVDPQAAARIHPTDPQRIQRALEVYRLSAVPLSRWWARAEKDAFPFEVWRIVLAPADREALHERIRTRFLGMLAQGLLDEVRALYTRGDLDPSLPSVRAVGYRQVWAYLSGEYSHEEMVECAIIATRQFAKRQYTWLRREQEASWYASDTPDLLPRVLAEARARLRL